MSSWEDQFVTAYVRHFCPPWRRRRKRRKRRKRRRRRRRRRACVSDRKRRAV
jgi:hypothetical protein